jgi:hypothetical protein
MGQKQSKVKSHANGLGLNYNSFDTNDDEYNNIHSDADFTHDIINDEKNQTCSCNGCFGFVKEGTKPSILTMFSPYSKALSDPMGTPILTPIHERRKRVLQQQQMDATSPYRGLESEQNDEPISNSSANKKLDKTWNNSNSNKSISSAQVIEGKVRLSFLTCWKKNLHCLRFELTNFLFPSNLSGISIPHTSLFIAIT